MSMLSQRLKMCIRDRYDPDIVTEANIGRQLFGPSDLGQNKAQCLVTRINN